MGETFAGVDYDTGVEAAQEFAALLPPGTPSGPGGAALARPAAGRHRPSSPARATPEQARGNAAAADLPPLTDDVLRQVAGAVRPADPAPGARPVVSRELASSSPGCPRPSCTSTTSARPRRAPSPSWPPGTRASTPVPADPDAARRLLHLHRLRALHRGLPLGRRPDPRRRGRPDAHLRGRARPGRPAGPLRRADADAVLVDRPRHPAEAFCEAVEDARVERRARPRRRAALVLRHPRRGRPAGRRRHPRRRPDPAPGRAGQLRPRRPGARRAAQLVRPALRRGPRRRAAQRPARRRVDRPGDDLGARSPTSAPSASATASPPRATRRCSRTWPTHGDPARGLPDVQRLHPLGARPRRSTRCRRWSPPASR